MANNNLQLSISLEYKDVEKALGRIEKKAQALQKTLSDPDDMVKLAKETDHWKSSVSKLFDQYLKLANLVNDGKAFDIDTKSFEQTTKRIEALFKKIRNAKDVDSIRKIFRDVNKELRTSKQEISNLGSMISSSRNNLSAAGRELKQMRQEAGGLGTAFDTVSKKTAYHNRLLTEGANILKSYFSVYTLQSFAKKLIEIGGEFQTQKVAIKTILGDIERGNLIFGQIKDLAVVSPFQFKELASYTKQLAAFNIPYSELFDTTKRLADISSGLGVDMSRLILAYGQVRSATVLRGQELRQFTEAGVPMVQALADELSRVKGTLVSTADVFDMIKKKQVTFEAVRNVLIQLTNEGGRFNDMQAVLADTISGKWSNLQDSFDIMLSNITEKGTLANTTIRVLLDITSKLLDVFGKFSTLFMSGVAVTAIFIAMKKIMSMMSGSLTDQILKAKTIKALEIETSVVEGKRTLIQNEILATKDRITKKDIQMLAMQGKLKTGDYARLVRQGLINKADIEELVSMKLITAEQQKQISLLSAKAGAVRSVVSAYWPMLAITAAIFAVSHVVNQWNTEVEGAGESADSATERFNTLNGAIEKLGDSSKMSEEELKSAIDGIMEKLDSLDPYYKQTLEEAKNIQNLSDKYDYLKGRINEVADAYRYASENRALFERLKHGEHGLLSDPMNGNFSDWSKYRNDAKSVVGSSGENIKSNILENLRKIYGEGSLYELLDKAHIGDFILKTQGKGLSNESAEVLWDYVKITNKANTERDKIKKQARESFEGILNEAINSGKVSNDYKNNIKDQQFLVTLFKTYVGSNSNYNDTIYTEIFKKHAREIFGFDIPDLYSTKDLAITDDILNDDDDNKPDKADAELAAFKKKIELYKSFYKVYTDYLKFMSSSDAITKLRSEGTFASVFGFNLTDISNFEASIKELLATLSLTSQDRQDYASDIMGDIASDNRKRFADGIDTLNKDLKTSLDLIHENFEMFSKWRKVVNDESAFRFAFGSDGDSSGMAGSKTYGDFLIRKATEYLESIGSGKSAMEVFGMSGADFNNEFGSNAAEISVYRSEYLEFQKKMRKETMDAIYEIINGHVDINAKIDAENDAYEQQLKLLEELEMSASDRNAAEKNVTDAHNEKLDELEFERLQKETDWVSVFDDMRRVSSDTIDDMIDRIDEFSRRSGLSINIVKKLRDALEKLKKEQNERNPFTIGSGMSKVSFLSSLLTGAGDTFSIKGKAKSLGIADGSYSRREIENMRTDAMEDLNQKFSGLADAFGKVEDALTPVIDLFEALGDSTLSNIFKAGGNALSAASKTYGGFQDLTNIAGGMKLGDGITKAIGNAGPYAAAAAAAIQVGSSLIKTALADSNRKKYEEMKEKLDDVNSTLKTINSNLKDRIGSQYGSESYDNGVKYLSNLAASEQYTREAAAQYLKIRNNILGRSKDTKMFNGAKNYGFNGTSWKSVSGQISSEFGMPFNSMEDLLKMNASTLESIREKYWGLWSALDPEFRGLLDDIIDIEGESEKLKDTLIEAYTGYSFDKLRDAFHDFAMDASKGIADLGRDFENTLRNAIINGMITDLYGDRIEAITDKMKEFRENDDKVVDGLGRVVSYYTAEESKSLRNMVEGVGEEIKESKDIIDDALGFSDANSASLSKSMGASMTEDTASLIGSYVNAIRADVSAMKMASIAFFSEIEGTGNVLAEQLASLKKIESGVTRMAGNSSEILSLLNDTIKGSKSFRVS